jgi:hypothetical protein
MTQDEMTLVERLRIGVSRLKNEAAYRIDELEAERAALKAMLSDAADDLEYHAQYAGEYLCEKHGVMDKVAAYREAAGSKT